MIPLLIQCMGRNSISLLCRLQMMSPVQDGCMHIADFLAWFCTKGRKWICIVHLYVCQRYGPFSLISGNPRNMSHVLWLHHSASRSNHAQSDSGYCHSSSYSRLFPAGVTAMWTVRSELMGSFSKRARSPSCCIIIHHLSTMLDKSNMGDCNSNDGETGGCKFSR